jgi:predicted RNase H-like nuclease
MVPFSISLDMAFAAHIDAKQRQQIVMVDIPISLTIFASSPKANRVKEKDERINNMPPKTIQ